MFKATLTALAAVAVLSAGAPAHAAAPVEARDRGHACDSATTVHSVKLINRTAHAKRFVATVELITGEGQSFSKRTHWAPAGGSRTVTFRSSEERYRAWAISVPALGDLVSMRLVGTSLCG